MTFGALTLFSDIFRVILSKYPFIFLKRIFFFTGKISQIKDKKKHGSDARGVMVRG